MSDRQDAGVSAALQPTADMPFGRNPKGLHTSASKLGFRSLKGNDKVVDRPGECDYY
jgi:hypothetical protein